MEKKQTLTSSLVYTCAMFMLSILFGTAQNMEVKKYGGAVVADGNTITVTAGSYQWFTITSSRGNCSNVKIRDIVLGNTTDFEVGTYYNGWYRSLPVNLKASSCRNGVKTLWFYVLNKTGNCSATTTVTIDNNRDPNPDFSFDFSMGTSPEIFVNGASFPNGDIFHGDTTTSDNTNTYFGVVEENATVTRSYIVSNIGSCTLAINALASSNSEFSVASPYPIPITRELGEYTVIQVTFTAPSVAVAGTHSSVISISNTDNTTFTFTVSAEMFDENIPGPGGITSDFKLWLKSTRGITTTGTSVTDWADLGTNGKDATTVSGKEPTYFDTASDNINYNPVVKFENGGGTEQYMYNATNPISGFYNHDIFIVMIPDATMTSASSRNTIFAGVDTGNVGDITGIGFGDYSSEFTNETLSYGQGVPGSGSFFNGDAEISSSYSGAGIINVRNDLAVSPTKQEILYNSDVLTTSNDSETAFSNISGSHYWLGKNFDVAGSLNGRVAEVFTFSERLDDDDRQKVESYLAIKYGITLGSSTVAQKDYINSFDDKVWDATVNLGYNYHVAGIGRDSISDLNQKQSKTINLTTEVSIGLGGVYSTNNNNTNEFTKDGDFLVWGNNNAAFTTEKTELVTIASGITTSLTHINRKWKIVETNDDLVDGNVGVVYVEIPETAFSGFSKLASEEYALIVADDPNFDSADIIDAIPLRIKTAINPGTGLPYDVLDENGSRLYSTWYNFDATKYFTFAKVAQKPEDHSVTLDGTNYLIGEYSLNLNSDAITISTWIKCDALGGDRTIMAKGEKLQIRLNPTGNLEMYIDDPVTPVFVSGMVVDDNKWHHVTFIYDSGTVILFIDGVLDKSEHDIVHPSPNFNHFALGGVYEDGAVTNLFIGEIDEVCVWDFAFTENQVRYFMNQELEENGSNFVDGKIIPYAASSNAMVAMPWSDLRAYYNFNSFYGSTTEGQTDDRFFLRLNYLDKNKELVEDQTAPLPYITASGGATWDTAATWSNNSDQVIPNTLALDGTTIVDWNIVQLDHSISSGDRDISVLGLIQTAGTTLTIADPTVTIKPEDNAGQALTVSHYLEIDGVIDLVGESQLIQTEGSIIDADSGGYIERDQQGTANGYNYNYWSSSVGPIVGNTATRGVGTTAVNANHTILAALKNGTDSDGYADLNFDTSPYGGTIPPPGLARTISSYWLYGFYGPEGDYNAWSALTQSSSIGAGEGFTMKGTSGAVSIATKQNYVFKGLPYNGDITLALDKSSGDVERLIGNPYPSAIDATEFILDNLSTADGGNNTNTVINGALYFWDHFGEENSHFLADYVGGYATRNLLGGAAAISNDARINNTSGAGGTPESGTKVPGQYIPVNQGFFVSTKVETGVLDDNGVQIDPIDGGDIVFKNSQRIYATEDGSTSLFLKSSSKKGSVISSQTEDDTPTVKLMFDSPKGYHRQIVLGVNDFASDGFDMGYDAFMVDVNEEDMYWNFSNHKFVIQGVNNFNTAQEFSLGVVVKEPGLASIKIDELENIDSNLSIYIKDSTTGETYKINNSAFEIHLEVGTYNDRFKVVFQSASGLSTDDVEILLDSVLLYYDTGESKIEIKKGLDTYILDITIYNLLGQKLQELEVNSSLKSISVPAKIDTGIYIFKLNTEKGLINRKMIIK